MASTPTILLINGLNFIPSPSITTFETEFAGILPQGTSIPSSWCVTGFYDFSPDASSSSRRANLVHEIGTSYIGRNGASRTQAQTNWKSRDKLRSLGHVLSSTPLTAHVSAIFHTQLLELLSYLK
jgi:hypothetical protein